MQIPHKVYLKVSYLIPNYIFTLGNQSNPNFNDIINNLTILYSNVQYGLPKLLLTLVILFPAELIMWFGTIGCIFILAFQFHKITPKTLFKKLGEYLQILVTLSIIGLLVQGFFFSLSEDFRLIYLNDLLANTNWTTGLTIFNNSIKIDIYTQFAKFFVLLILVSLCVYMPSLSSMSHYTNLCEVPILLSLCVSLTLVILSCNHFALLIITLEGFSLILYILTTIDRTQGGITAAAKYFTFGTFGSILMFWGTAQIYSTLLSLSYENVFFLLDWSQTFVVKESFLFSSLESGGYSLLLGLLLKLGAAPLHQWVPDVYAGVHLFITLFFATFVKIVLFLTFVKLALFFASSDSINIFAISSLVLGNLIAIKQMEIKRFLAYSSISHTGFLLIGDLTSSLFYSITYILSTILFFSIILNLKSFGKNLIYIADLKLLKQSGNWYPFLCVIALASMSGIPPFCGFFGKFLVWISLFEDVLLFNDYATYGLLFISIFFTLLSIFYYTRIIIFIYIVGDKQSSKIVTKPLYLYNIHQFSIIQLNLALALFISGWIVVHSSILNVLIMVSFSMQHYN